VDEALASSIFTSAAAAAAAASATAAAQRSYSSVATTVDRFGDDSSASVVDDVHCRGWCCNRTGRVRGECNQIALTSILDRGQFVYW